MNPNGVEAVKPFDFLDRKVILQLFPIVPYGVYHFFLNLVEGLKPKTMTIQSHNPFWSSPPSYFLQSLRPLVNMFALKNNSLRQWPIVTLKTSESHAIMATPTKCAPADDLLICLTSSKQDLKSIPTTLLSRPISLCRTVE